MKRLLFSAVALTLLATASCKKDDDATGPSNSVTAAGETYQVTAMSITGRTVRITGGSGSNNVIYTLRFGTGTATPSTGTYNIVKEASSANQVDVSVARSSNSTITSYESQDNSPNVAVTMDGNKMKISFPNTTVKPVAGLGSEDIVVSANATQP